jgi:xanthine dehydrogenase accessory factor
MTIDCLIWGGGDLATGVALRLHRVGLSMLIVERAQPLAVRRTVSFAQAVYDGVMQIEDVVGRLVADIQGAEACCMQHDIPVLIDPDLTVAAATKPFVLVDARMRKKAVDISLDIADLVIGLGPGFKVGINCHAAVETNRGHFLGRVYWEGGPQADTGVPGQVQAYRAARVLHAPAAGVVKNRVPIGSLVEGGQTILSVGGQTVQAPFDGLLRGLIHNGVRVAAGVKVGDVDPRPETFRCQFVSEKSLAIGGGVLEAILTQPALRQLLWQD